MNAPDSFLRKIGLIISVCMIVFCLASCSGQQQGGFAQPPVPVEMAEVKNTVVTDKLDAVGNVKAADAITVVSEIDAKVVELPFIEGQYIEKGGLIAQLDDSQARAEVASAQATLDQAKVTYDRTKEIVDADAAARQDLDNATASLKIAQAQLDQAKVRLNKTRLIAPFSGVLGTRRVSPGAYLRAGDAVTTLTNISQLRVNFSAPERSFPFLSRGSAVRVSSPAYPDYELTGKIEVVDPVVDESTRSVKVIALVDNKDKRLRPGMSANVTAVLRQRPDALTIPDEAVFSQGNQAFVYVVKPDSSVVRTAITLGTRQSGSVEVTRGLSSGQEVVSAGHQKLYDGAKVMSIPAGTQESTGATGQSGDEPDSTVPNR